MFELMIRKQILNMDFFVLRHGSMVIWIGSKSHL